MAAITYSTINLSTTPIELRLDPATFTYRTIIPHVVVGYSSDTTLYIPYYHYENNTWTTPDNLTVEEHDGSFWKGKNTGNIYLATRTPSNDNTIKEYNILNYMAFENSQTLTDITCTTYTMGGQGPSPVIPASPSTAMPTVFPFFIKNSVRWPIGPANYPSIYFIHDPLAPSIPQTFRVFLPECLNLTLNISYITNPDDVTFTENNSDPNHIYIVGASNGDKFEIYYLYNYTSTDYDNGRVPQLPVINTTNKQGTVDLYGPEYMATLLPATPSGTTGMDNINFLTYETKTDMDLKIEKATKKPGYIVSADIADMFITATP